MTLAEQIENTVSLGRSITFKKNILQLEIIITDNVDGETDTEQLPLHDHCTDDKLIICIEFQNQRLNAK